MSKISLNAQVETGNLVCPRTHMRLKRVNGYLETIDGKTKYDVINEVPILFPDILTQQAYLQESGGEMNKEYIKAKPNAVIGSIKKFIAKDFRNKEAIASFNEIFDNLADNSLAIAVGGGPVRHHPQLINLNIGAFTNVDVVADAYNLPYADSTVDAVYIEAVLEHLEFPERAVIEIFRVLKKGGKVYADTPFMQGFHGYPNHFQNFTIEGHRRLFSRNGFTITKAGTSVGPTFAFFAFLIGYIRIFTSRTFFKYPFLAVAHGLMVIFKPIDRLIHHKSTSNILASSTFIYATK